MDRRALLRFAKGTILDVGCGDALFIWNGYPPSYVTCLDIDVYKHTNVEADAHYLPFRDKSFDTVLLFEILEHVDDVEQVVREAFRVARQRVLISYPHESLVDLEGLRKCIQFLKEHGLVKMCDEVMQKAHTHWKSEERIQKDIETIRKFNCKELKLDYGMYDGWGFICTP